MAEEKILQDILNVMEREAASQRSKPVKLGNAAVGQQIEQLANAGKVAGILLSIKDNLLSIPEVVTEIPEAIEENIEARKEETSIFETLVENIDSMKAGLGKFTQAVTVDLVDNLKELGKSVKEGAKKTGTFLLTLVALAGAFILAAKFFEGFFKSEGTLGEKLQGGLKEVFDLLPIKEETKESIIGFFKSLGETFAPYIEEIKAFLNPIIDELATFFKTTFVSEIQTALDFLTAQIVEAASQILESLKELPVIGSIIKQREAEEVKQREFIDEQLLRESPGAFTDIDGNEISFDDPRREQMREAFLSRVDAPVTRLREEQPVLGAILRPFGAITTSEMARTGIGRTLARAQNAIDDLVDDYVIPTIGLPIPISTAPNDTGTQIEVQSQAREIRTEAENKAIQGILLGGFNSGSRSEQKNITQNNISNTYNVSGLQEQPGYSN